MNSKCKLDEIDVIGLCNPTSIDLTTFNHWTQIAVPETLIIPEQKPDIEQLISVSIDAEIIRQKVIVTPDSATVENEEGKLLTGRKLIVEGLLCQKVTYVADVCEQSVHTAEFAIPFSAFIVIPLTFTFDAITVNAEDLVFNVNVCIEDVFIKGLCKREIFKNITLLLQAVPDPTACLDNC